MLSIFSLDFYRHNGLYQEKAGKRRQQKQKDGMKAGMHKIDYVQSNDRLGFKM